MSLNISFVLLDSFSISANFSSNHFSIASLHFFLTANLISLFCIVEMRRLLSNFQYLNLTNV